MNKKNWVWKTTLSAQVLLFATHAHAIGITWNGFASAYGQKSTTNDIYETSLGSKNIDFSNDTRIGLNLRSDFSEHWAAVAQAVASGRNSDTPTSNPDWAPRFDWLYVAYTPSNPFTFKIGRQLFPHWLAEEYIDVGLTYPWVRPPEQVYGASPFKTFEGLSASWQTPLGEAVGMLRLFGGASQTSIPSNESINVNLDNLLGIQLGIEGDGWQAQSVVARYNAKSSTPAGYSGTLSGSKVTIQAITANSQAQGVQFWSVGGRYDRYNILAYAEYGLFGSEEGTSVGGGNFLHQRGSYYGTLGYHIDRFLPHYTYAYSHVDIGIVSGDEASHSVGVNYQINPSVVAKIEYVWWYDTDGKVTLSSQGQARTLTAGVDVVF